MRPPSWAQLLLNCATRGTKSAMPLKTTCLFLIIQICSCLTQVPRGTQSDATQARHTSDRSHGVAMGSKHSAKDKIETHLEAIASDPIDHLSVTRATNRAGRRARRLAGAFNFLLPPKLVQWSKEPVQYYEGSTLVLSCSLSQSGGEQPQLKFGWFRNGRPLQSGAQQRLSIETLADYSFLRLAELGPSDSGSYTCVASNSLGQEDRTTTQVLVDVKLKWISNNNASGDQPHVNRTLLDGDTGHQLVKSRAAQTVVFECNVAGGQRPQIRWFKLVAASSKARASHGKVSQQRPDQGFLDETQLKTTLSQLDALQADAQMQRYELINEGGMIDKSKALFNESSGKQFRWRVETNGGASSNKQTQELFSRLILDRVEPGASGLYGCDASSTTSALEPHSSSNGQPVLSGQDALSLGATRRAQFGDKLHRFFGLVVNDARSLTTFAAVI